MAAVAAFLGMLLISMVVALLAALQLGDFFGAGPELAPVLAVVMAFSAASLAVFAVACRLTPRAGPLGAVALILAVLALAPILLPGLIRAIAERSTNPYTVGIENTYITIELVVPALLAVLVQWGLVRRHWLRTAGAEEMTRWPWFTTGVACLVILNPLGLTFLKSTLLPSGGDFMWQFVATITAGVLGALLVMAWVECYIRDRMLNRRSEEAAPPSHAATTH